MITLYGAQKWIQACAQGHKRISFKTDFNLLVLCMWLQVINKVKVTHQGEGHIKVKEKYLYPFKFYVAHTLYKRVVCIRLKCYYSSHILTVIKHASEA